MTLRLPSLRRVALVACAVWSAATLPLPNVRVSHDRYAAHMEPSLAVNPHDPRALLGAATYLLAAHSFNGGRVPGTFASSDGGSTWHDNGPLPLPPGYGAGSNVSVAVTAGGVGFVAVRADSGPQHTGIFVWRTMDGGRHFAPPVAVAAGDPRVNVDHPWLAVERATGALDVAWSVSGPNRGGIAFSRSVDGGRHFATPRTITGSAQRADVVPVLITGPAGAVAVVYADVGAASAGEDGVAGLQRARIVVVRSTDGGRYFGPSREITAATLGVPSARPLALFALPAAATDPRDGALYVAVARERPGLPHPDLVLLRSRDGGETWTARRVANEPGATHTMHLQPQLAVTPDGVVGVSYLTLARGRIDLYLAQSRDHGASFGPAVRVTDRPWDPARGLDLGSGQFWVGDYQGLTAGPHMFDLVWTDTRTGRLELFAAAVAA